VLQEALGDLAAAEREALDRILSRVLVGLIRGPGATRWMCRFCDTTACGRQAGHCPVANTARERYAS
jgi:rubrerythrin